MKVAAHPLVVAVALGLIAPDALEAQPLMEPPECADCPDPGSFIGGSTTLEVSEWAPGESPSDEELHRVELEWLKASR